MFQLFLATPDKKIVSDSELSELTVPAHAGELNILPGHAPLMTTLDPGIVSYKLKNGQADRLAIGWGYCQVSAEGVSVLVETATASGETDRASLEKEVTALEAKFAQESMSDEEWKHLEQRVATLRAQIALN